MQHQEGFTPAFLARLKPAYDLDARLAARKALRLARSAAARRGWQTRRSA